MTSQSLLENTRNIGFVAHIDAGKTTVSERALFVAGRIHKMGGVDDGTTALDWMAQERERGITITSASTTCQWGGHTINVIDTPGHVDFTAEVERSLRILDGGVVIFDAVAGVQPQSETVWRQADRYQVPRICFINKMDRIGADFHRTIDSIAHRFNITPVAIQIPIGVEDSHNGVIDLVEGKALIYHLDSLSPEPPTEGPVPEELVEEFHSHRESMIERIAETDDNLITKYIEGQEITKDEIKKALRKATIKYQLVPVLCGSALKNVGVHPLLDAVADYLPSPLDIRPAVGKNPVNGAEVTRSTSAGEPFAALAFKAVADPFIGRLVYFRVYSGQATAGATVYNSTTGQRERMGRIVRMHAQHREELDKVVTGEIAAAIGLKGVSTGDTLCDQDSPIILETITFPDPVMSVSIEPKTRGDQDRLIDALSKLADEDPTLKISFDEEVGQTIMSGMGELHLEIIVDRVRREYKVEGNVGRPKVAYREAITRPARAEGRLVRQTGGHGQYGHVWLEVAPVKRGAGFEFHDKIRGGVIPREFIPAVRHGVEDAMGAGPLSGYPVVDVSVELVDGSYHEVDSSEMAFRIAGSIAAKEAIRRARPVLLEPIMALEVVTPGEFLGDLLGELGRRRATIRSIEGLGNTQVVKAKLPLAESFGYVSSLRSLTQGRASHSMEFEDYEQAPAEVAAAAV